MKDKTIDKYISQFEFLIRRAGWTRDDQNTVKEFVAGLSVGLAMRILNRNPPPNKHNLTAWLEAAREEVVKEQERFSMIGGYGKRQDIVRENRFRKSGTQKVEPRRAPYKDPDAMEVDMAQTERKAPTKKLSDEERRKYFEEG